MSQTKSFQSYNYMTGSVNGSLAFDFGSPALEVPERVAAPLPRVRPETRPKVREEAVPRTEAVSAVRQAVSPVAIIGCVAAAVMMLLLLLAKIQMTALSDSAVQLTEQLEELSEVQNNLIVEYETAFNLALVEDYAVNVLGMQEPREEQIYYLNGISPADKAEVFTKEEKNMFVLGLEDIADSFMEYFDRLR